MGQATHVTGASRPLRPRSAPSRPPPASAVARTPISSSVDQPLRMFAIGRAAEHHAWAEPGFRETPGQFRPVFVGPVLLRPRRERAQGDEAGGQAALGHRLVLEHDRGVAGG